MFKTKQLTTQQREFVSWKLLPSRRRRALSVILGIISWEGECALR